MTPPSFRSGHRATRGRWIPGLLGDRRFAPVFVAQFASAVGDTLLRTAIGILALWSTARGPAWIPAAAAAAFVAPSLLLSGLGGVLADRFDKGRVVRALKLAELPVAFGAASVLLAGGHLLILLAILVAYGTLAALFGPVKYGILPEQLAPARLPAANALVETATFAAILGGTIGAALLLASAPGAALLASILVGLASLAAASAFAIPRVGPASPGLRVGIDLAGQTASLLRELAVDPRSLRAAGANALFWAVGAVVLSLLPVLVRDRLGGGPLLDGLFLTAFAAGVAAGSAVASFAAVGRPIVVTASLGSCVLGLALLASSFVATPRHLGLLGASLFVAAAGAGLLAVPTQSLIQFRAAPDRRARRVGATNVLSSAAIAIASLALIAAERAGCGAPALLAATGIASLAAAPVLGVALPARPAPELAFVLLRLLFRLRVAGAEHFRAPPGGGGVLFAPNHVSWLDAIVLYAVIGTAPAAVDRVAGDALVPAFAIDGAIARRRLVRPFLRFAPVIEIEPADARGARAMIDRLRGGASLVLFPEGRISPTGWLMEVQDGAATIADRARVPVVAIRLDGLERSPVGAKAPGAVRRALLPRVTVTALPPVRLGADEPAEGGHRRRDHLTASLRDLMEDAVYRTARTDGTLWTAVARAAAVHGRGRVAIEDPVSGPLSYRRLLAGADLLGGVLARCAGGLLPGAAANDDAPVGVLLPTSNACALVLLGLNAHGQIAVLLNPTAGLAGLRAAIATARVALVVTARGFVDKAELGPTVDALAATTAVLFLEDARAGIGRAARLRALGRAQFRPRPRVATAGDATAVILFTSGSSGTPKGVALSNRNLLANLAQVSGRIGFGRADRLLNTLPMFHAFGLTGGFLLPLTSGIPVFLYPSPLHYAAIPAVAYRWNATAMFGTSTFLRGYARRAHPQAFRSLRLVIAGGERLRPDVRAVWAERFGLRVLEGYGATECAPVLALNTPSSNRSGTVGRLVPDLRMRLVPVDGVTAGGRLLVSGPNVMRGYLRDDGSGAVVAPPDGWYDTGDVATVDDDGHLTVVGRASRFAKPGGEMVSLAAVENLADALWPDAMSVALAVPDERRGERVVLLTTAPDATRDGFVAHARANGAPELLTPSAVRVLPALPLLGSGKPDLVACAALPAAHPHGTEDGNRAASGDAGTIDRELRLGHRS